MWSIGEEVRFITPANVQNVGAWKVIKVLKRTLHLESLEHGVTIKRVAFDKVELVPPPPPPQIKLCAHCGQAIDVMTQWNSASSCCTRSCSDQLVRTCPECRIVWTRATSKCDNFCSGACFDAMNKRCGYVYCPMYA